MKFSGDAARAGRWQLVNVDEQTFAGIARVEGEHAVVDVLLEALAPMTWSQSAARSPRVTANLNALGLRVDIYILDDNSPFAQDVGGADWAGVFDVAGADETFTADPVALVELLAVVERVIEFLFLLLGHAINQIVGRLVGNIGVFLQD